ncbi:MAG TPA: L,D-transpeptidase [Paracoccus sp. (in: a-proteobacteria)]|uniref:L,D-transpeptidase n=1 Tax=uncultured Paracoccus sp. TaxID=189685 RepID=UPI00262B2932|nr:L,D-transpeptidase [uncultured Paracoccus sp.]HMQ39737.1 L,D-transpeptidase [Paracoccus sp. (in: a-proteobacteria)]HMR36340.1 L,D-transpeptidase [Paracoccus sp. (in: a-proteobacteria)]
MRLIPIALAVVLGLAACAPTPQTAPAAPGKVVPAYYEARTDSGPNGEPIQIAAVKTAYLNERTMRTNVPYNGPESAGTIVVDPFARVLYYVQPGGMAERYGVAVGAAGKNFAGNGTIARKAAWPSWTPTSNMVNSQPELYGPLKGGMAGGPDNPLGSRALYLYQGGRDTYYRIHGTLDPSSIGKATSAGCIRMFNQDIIDLFNRVPTGTTVHVRSQSESVSYEGPVRESPEGYAIPVNQMPAVTTTSAPAASPVESAVRG